MIYGWKIKGTPLYFVKRQTLWITASHANWVVVDISMKHNSVRDSQIIREVCRDVQIEPALLPITESEFERKINM